MNVRRIALANIRSYKYQEIEFPSGSILLSGDVGAGKTTLLLAIEFALFGLQPGQRGSSLLANGEDEGKVTLEFEIDGEKVQIERTLRRTSRGVSQEECALTVHGERREMAVTELKSQILELLNYPEEFVKKTNLLYKYTVYAPQEEMKSIILEDGETRLNILRNIFGIEKYRRIKENSALVGIKLREQVRIAQAQVKDMSLYAEKIKEAENSIELAEKEVVQLEKEIFLKKETRKKTESEVRELQEKIQESVRLEKELEKANVQYTNKAMSLNEIENELRKSAELLNDAGKDFDPRSYEKNAEEIAVIKKKMESIHKEIIELSGKMKSLELRKNDDLEKRKRVFSVEICPTCLQDISENHKHNIAHDTESKIVEYEKERKKAEAEIALKEKEREILQQSLVKTEAERHILAMAKVRQDAVKYARTRKDDLEKSRLTINADITALVTHIRSLKESILGFAKFKAQLTTKDAELRNNFSEEKKSEIRYAEKRKEKEFLNKEMQRLKDEQKGKQDIQKKLKKLAELESWISGSFADLIGLIERRVLLHVREEFSRLFNKWFSLLTTDSFTVQLDETFTPVIRHKDHELEYGFLSGGERTAIALAYRLALNQILNSMHSNIKTRDIIILDEPTDGFSEQQLDKVRDILREIKAAQLIIVSHEPKMESFVDNVVKIRKDSGFSIPST